MYNFILQIIIMLSLGTIIYLIARTVPRIDDEISKPETKFDHWIDSVNLKRIDALLSNSLEKILRKNKLFLMKLDNLTTVYLDKIKKSKPGNGQNNKEEKPNLFNSNRKEGEGES